MRILIVLASVIAVALCAGQWSQPDLSDTQVSSELCENLLRLQTTKRVTFDQNNNGCPEIISVEQQVVAGMNYKYILKQSNRVCMLQYYERSWDNYVDIKADNCSLAVTDSTRQLGGLMGGYSSQSVNDPEYTDLLVNMTTKGLLTASATNTYDIQSVQTQVVSGVNYKYTLVNKKTGQTCELVIYVQAWTDTYSVSSDDCSVAVASKRQLLGGSEVVAGGITDISNTDEPGLKQCIAYTLDDINMQSNSMFRMVESGVSATKQVVQGVLYRITLSVSESTCTNGQDTMGLTATDCPVSTTSNMAPASWTSECWYRDWMKDPAEKLQISNLNMVTY